MNQRPPGLIAIVIYKGFVAVLRTAMTALDRIQQIPSKKIRPFLF
ncbi:hypothetical protein [Dolichospermum compactum]|uniref:Uncharacterized protein n=1 Tax=Dolichospermum compactum NIES-806 TaxID=1973481 RepID=A0A1Z4V3W2_9CYAN|nr:hypothetical protein [Dolichospermum compactum]BAZ85985.1 hypothetical protein NIES806_21900 [Dolichospermum compactum NIES-806]